MTATQRPSTPSSTALPSAPHGATSPQHPNRLPIPSIPAYEVLLQQQEESRGVFGRMLLNWRRRNGWTQYTACSWAEAIGEPSLVISYGNLSVIEQGKAGELRQRAFWQLWELNRRIASGDWGRIGDAELRRKLEGATPIGDDAAPVWGPLEFWACYCGLRPVPPAFASTPAPLIGARQAAVLSSRWRRQLQALIEEHQLDAAVALDALMALAGEEHRRDFYAVLTGFRRYTPAELSVLWVEKDRYRPELWLEQWQRSLPAATAAAA